VKNGLNGRMAQKVVTQLIDDLDGKELADGKGETVTFALDGTNYEIDLSHKNADALREVLQDYIAAGRKRSGGRSAGKPSRSGPSAHDVRMWGVENGVTDSGRGRVGKDLKAAYNAANPTNRYN
jgi:hypothetical protein